MVKVSEVIANYDGVARAKHLAAAGVSDFQLRTALVPAAQSPGWPAVSTQHRTRIRSCRPSAPCPPSPPVSARPSSPGFGCSDGRTTARRGDPQPQLPRICLPSRGGPADPAGHRGSEPALPAGAGGPRDCRIRRRPQGPSTVSRFGSGWPAEATHANGRIAAAIVPQSQSVIECMARFLLRRAGLPRRVAGEHTRGWAIWTSWWTAGSGSRPTVPASIWTGQVSKKIDGGGTSPPGLAFRPGRHLPLLKYRPHEFVAMVREALNRISAAA